MAKLTRRPCLVAILCALVGGVFGGEQELNLIWLREAGYVDVPPLPVNNIPVATFTVAPDNWTDGLPRQTTTVAGVVVTKKDESYPDVDAAPQRDDKWSYVLLSIRAVYGRSEMLTQLTGQRGVIDYWRISDIPTDPLANQIVIRIPQKSSQSIKPGAHFFFNITPILNPWLEAGRDVWSFPMTSEERTAHLKYLRETEFSVAAGFDVRIPWGEANSALLRLGSDIYSMTERFKLYASRSDGAIGDKCTQILNSVGNDKRTETLEAMLTWAPWLTAMNAARELCEKGHIVGLEVLIDILDFESKMTGAWQSIITNEETAKRVRSDTAYLPPGIDIPIILQLLEKYTGFDWTSATKYRQWLLKNKEKIRFDENRTRFFVPKD